MAWFPFRKVTSSWEIIRVMFTPCATVSSS